MANALGCVLDSLPSRGSESQVTSVAEAECQEQAHQDDRKLPYQPWGQYLQAHTLQSASQRGGDTDPSDA